MKIRQVLRDSIEIISDTKILFLGGGAIAGTKLFGSLLALTYPPLYLFGAILSLFGTPLVSAGFLSWLRQAENNPSEITIIGFYKSGRLYYPLLLLSNIAVFSLVIGLVILFTILLAPFSVEFISQVSAYTIGDPLPTDILTSLTYIGALLLIVTLTPLFMFQFVSPSIVVSQNRLFRSFEESAQLLYYNIFSVLRYNLTQLGITVFIGLPATILRLIATAGILSRGLPPRLQIEFLSSIPLWGYFILLVLSFILSTITETIKGSLLVSYYQSISRTTKNMLERK